MRTVACLPHQYEHETLCCNLCDKGTYVSTACGTTTVTKCQACPENSFMNERNGLNACLPCRRCDTNSHLREDTTCTSHSDTKCTCKDGYYCMDYDTKSCNHCKQITPCPPGEGVSAEPTHSKDTECRPCLSGTFNNMTDYRTPCYNHTSCEKLGRYLVTPGTTRTDAECGEFLRSCYGISAGMGTALVLTILICAGLLYWMAKHKQQKTVNATESPHSDRPSVLPPDIIHLQTYDHTDEICTRRDACTMQCHCIPSTAMAMLDINGFPVSQKMYSAISSNTSFLHSEPQEDEWPGS